MGKSIDNLITFLESHKNADNAHHMAVYMKNQFPFFGIKTQGRSQFLKCQRGVESTSPEWLYLNRPRQIETKL